jgi:hypothetical protein
MIEYGMARFSPLLPCLLCGLLIALAPARGEPAWPPEFMKKLPPDYLERLRASLTAGTSRLEKMKGGNEDRSIGWVRYGQPALLLGQKSAEIDGFFESDKFTWTANPKFGFSLFSTSYMRLYALMNRRTGRIQGPLSPAAEAAFEREMWKVAKANSSLAEAKRGVWEMEGSENHHISSKTCDLLAAQFLRKIPAYADQKLDDGSTLAQQYEVRQAYWLKWFDERAKRGQFAEAGSPSYQSDSVAALFNVRDFAEDEVLRRKADMYLDLTFAVMAEETLLTTRGGSKSRVKVGHEYDGGMAGERSYNVLFNAPGRTFDARGENTLSTSDYFPPPAVVALATDTKMRGTYAFAHRWPGPVAEGGAKGSADPDGELWRTLDPERSVLRYGYATPAYVLGSAAVDPSWLNDVSMGFRWQGVVFASDPLSRIGFEVQPRKDNDWHGFNPFFSLQDRNVLITQKWAPVPPNPASSNPARLRVYFAPTLGEVQEEGGWIFVRDGDAYAGLKVVAGGWQWAPAWKHADTAIPANRAFLTLDTDSPVILVVNQAADYRQDFAAFKAALQAQAIERKDGVLHFATLTSYGPAKVGEINGTSVNLAPARGYDSPFIRSTWNSGLIHIRKGSETLILDFRDPQNPRKTLGAPITPVFPPGVGGDEPIVFGRKAAP